MLVGFVISVSALLQFITAVQALRLIKLTGWRISWALISTAIFFMGVRRCIALFHLVTGNPAQGPELSYELVGLVTSGLMLAGVSSIAPLFITIKRSERAVQQSEAKYRSLVESTEDSIYLVDRDYRYLFINKKHLERLGIAEDQYIGRSYGDFHSPEITRQFIETAGRVFRTGESIQHEHRSERDNEYFLLTLSPVKDADGDTTAVTVVSKKISDLKRMEENLRALSLTDELTGIYNRRGFLTLADQHLKAAKRAKNRVFMLYADLDGLKVINDTFGHGEGDRALIDVSNILKETYRESDIIARIGGDEFVVMPVGTNDSCIDIILSRLGKNLEAYNLTRNSGYRLSMSLGIAYFDPENPCSVDELLAHGDRMMYEEKRLRKSVTPKS